MDNLVDKVLKRGYKSFDTVKKKLWCHFHEVRSTELKITVRPWFFLGTAVNFRVLMTVYGKWAELRMWIEP